MTREKKRERENKYIYVYITKTMCTIYTYYGVARSFIVYVPQRRRMSRTSLVGATAMERDGGRRIKEREDKRGRWWGRREIKYKKKTTRRDVTLFYTATAVRSTFISYL